MLDIWVCSSGEMSWPRDKAFEVNSVIGGNTHFLNGLNNTGEHSE